MPQTIQQSTDGTQIIGGAFSNAANVPKAVEEFRKLGYFGSEVRVISKEQDLIKTKTVNVSNVETNTLVEEGIAQTQSKYFIDAVEAGKTAVFVYNVTESGPVIDIFDRFGADYNPNGDRNLRHDVAGMTVGAAAGATALGALGGVIAGPIGLAAGISGGALVGGVAGAAAGASAEHKK